MADTVEGSLEELKEMGQNFVSDVANSSSGDGSKFGCDNNGNSIGQTITNLLGEDGIKCGVGLGVLGLVGGGLYSHFTGKGVGSSLMTTLGAGVVCALAGATLPEAVNDLKGMSDYASEDDSFLDKLYYVFENCLETNGQRYSDTQAGL